jgi:hypothetical protein
MRKVRALVVSNGIEGLHKFYRSNDSVEYIISEITKDYDPDFTPYDILIAPNGTDHVAFYRIRNKVKEFLDAGKTLFCFDGWFTNWVPGNRWIMDNSKKTIDIRYRIKENYKNLATKFSVNDLTFSHGMSGWWACGYILPATGAMVVLADTWDRALLVIDKVSTNGTMVLTASGPLADVGYNTEGENKAYGAMTDLYKFLLALTIEEMTVYEK